MSTPAKMRALRDGRAAAGLCTTCGKRPPVAGIRYCAECRRQKSRHMASRRATMKRLGLCFDCLEKTNRRATLCKPCARARYADSPPRPKDDYPVWTREEVSEARLMASEGMTAEQIGQALGRATGAVRTKCRREGISIHAVPAFKRASAGDPLDIADFATARRAA